ncbi:hypothetical protein [Anaerobiospirillum succiniciproducens]|uniref:hypothetical protein n=1 Tax=Anaerobiospirillum succiniciproducens TaxID=13335 RepID=UPI002943423A|nr:hypothetical protein [Anaerobiospirillum succiniciproducens]
MLKLRITNGFHLKGIASMANLEFKDDPDDAAGQDGLFLADADAPSLAYFLVNKASVPEFST